MEACDKQTTKFSFLTKNLVKYYFLFFSLNSYKNSIDKGKNCGHSSAAIFAENSRPFLK